jgi:hypothetical protein
MVGHDARQGRPNPGVRESRKLRYAPIAASLERPSDIFQQGKLFLETARYDPWRANIVLQLAESAGDQIDSLFGYIDKLLAILPSLLRFEQLGLDGYETHLDEMPTSEQASYLCWFAELGALERGNLERAEPKGHDGGGPPVRGSHRLTLRCGHKLDAEWRLVAMHG